MGNEKRWTLLSPPQAAAAALFRDLKVHPALCSILAQRGIDNFENAKTFFRPQLEQLHSPWLMKDMQKAVHRIAAAIAGGEKILVYGDYDVDGTTSVACMYQFLHSLHDEVDYYIPHRYKEGYGISQQGIDWAHEAGFHLIISLDCGIKSIDLIGYAKELGIDFIVCDHHLPDAQLPPAVAILNPKQKDCAYPYKELCGCGVGFKLITALCTHFGLPPEKAHQYLDLVATAIAADIVDMTGENRVLAYYGLKKAGENPNLGIKALSMLSGIDKELHIHNLVFMIAPRVNAAGRMDDARKAVQLFIANTLAEALRWAEELHTDNSSRKEADTNTTEEALALIQGDEVLVKRQSTVLYQPHWHKGVVGIVASRLIEHYYRPTIILTESGDYVAGSARSVAGFNVYEAIHQCKDLLLGYGGHFYAAGLTLKKDMVDAFCSRFEEVVSTSIHPSLLVPELVLDAEIKLKDITPSFYKILEQMEPYGPGNLRPLFISRGVTDTGFSRIVKERHLKFSIRQNGMSANGIGFDLAHKAPLLQSGRPVDLVYKIDLNEWNGERTLQLKVVDLKASEN